jgi:hypothetical protein
MNEGALVPVHEEGAVLVAAATLDGIACAAVWARRIPLLRAVLFAPEGQTGRVFAMPALISSDAKWQNIYCAGLSLAESELEAVSATMMRPGLRQAIWLDHHHLHRACIARLRNYESSCSLLLRHLHSEDKNDRRLCEAVRAAPDQLDEPWRSWLFVFLAVQPESFSIHHAIQPLIEGRPRDFDSALRADGELRWREMVDFARSPFHSSVCGEQRLVVAGLASTQRLEFRLLVDEIIRGHEADLCLVFFDYLPRLVLRAKESLLHATWVSRLDELLAGSGA